VLLDQSTKVVRAIKGISPVQVAVDTNHVEVWLDQSELASTSALLGVKAIAESTNQALADLVPQVESNSQTLTALSSDFTTALAGKQDALSQPGFGATLLYGNRVKRVAFGAGITGGTDEQPDGTQTLSLAVSSSRWAASSRSR
jgi:hypothetical protein